MICKRITITGKVQGVYFRASTQEKAEELGLTGEVLNLPDGSVEAIACGPEDAVEALVAWCHEGPPRARVEEVKVENVGVAAFDGFRIARR